MFIDNQVGSTTIRLQKPERIDVVPSLDGSGYKCNCTGQTSFDFFTGNIKIACNGLSTAPPGVTEQDVYVRLMDSHAQYARLIITKL